MLAAAPQMVWSQHEPAVVETLNSLRPLDESDRAALQPTRLRIVEAQAGQTLRELSDDPRTVPKVARLNRIGPDTPLSEGQAVKLLGVGQFERASDE